MQLCNVPVSFVTITQFIHHVTENMDNLDLRNGRHERNVWEMHTQISWEILWKTGGNIKLIKRDNMLGGSGDQTDSWQRLVGEVKKTWIFSKLKELID